LAPLCTSESKDECQGEKCKQEECCQVVPLPTCAGTENICDGKNSDGVQLFDIKADTNLHTFIGCFKDDWDRAMPINAGNVGKDVSKCAELCKAKSMPFMGLQHDDCFCSQTKAEYSKHGKREDKECSVQGNGGTAGADWRNSVYTVDDIKCSKLAGCEVSECCTARDSCSSGDKQNGLCSKDKGLELLPEIILGAKGSVCEKGTAIKTKEECSKAMGELGFNTRVSYSGNWGHVPSGCSMYGNGRDHTHFNANAAGNGRGDLTPLCIGSKAECQGERCEISECCKVLPPPPKFTLGAKGSVCEKGTAIKTKEECSKALGVLGFNTHIQHSGNWGHVPSGCSGVGDTHFNTNAAGNGRGDLAPICDLALK